MNIIKLNAIDSTNSFLKDLAKNTTLENYTTVVAATQKNGRGQQENKWHSEPRKNLTTSIFIKLNNLQIAHQKYLNFAVSIAVFETLESHKISKLNIKWPNDILSANKKIAGILIENSLLRNSIKHTVVGIGLNVNQEIFPSYLPNAISMKNQLGRNTEIFAVLDTLVIQLKKNIGLLNRKEFASLEKKYLSELYI